MIRFYDSDVGCVEYNLLNRKELLSYFFSGHLDEIVCVYDGSDEENFVGIITYYSLLYAISIDRAIIKEYVLLDQDVWQNAREIFKKKGPDIWKIVPLPVLNKDYQLICFAYQDEDANREIRMLRELRETQGVLQFSDMFPEYKCVRIHEFNELAFFFAEYLRMQNIQVQVDSAMWQDFFIGEDCQVPEYECLNIYAEGIASKPVDWRKNLLRTVSVEFECIDIIYEANLKNGIIKNNQGDCNSLFERLRGEKEIVVLGTGIEAQDAYNFLIGNGIDVCCFVDNVSSEDNHRIFGKAILNEFSVINKYENPVFIDCISQNSAWGGGKIDDYDYLGYERNKQFIVLKDYIQIKGEYLIKSISASKAFLVGDIYLCKYLYDYFKKNMVVLEGYLDVEGQNDEMQNLPRISIDDIDSEMMCLIVIPEYFTPRNMQAEIMRRVVTYLKENGIDNYSNYFSSAIPFIYIEGMNDLKYMKRELRPKRIVLGSIEGCCGNVFFRSLLDGHPSIMMTNYNHVNDTLLNDNLFLLCVRLSTEESDNILPLFWKIYGDEGRDEIRDRQKFNKKMRELLGIGNTFTPQELFVMFHIAYMYMQGKNIAVTDIADMVIYWEPHFMERERLEECEICFNSEKVSCDIVNIVRNICMRNGAIAKGYISMGWLGDKAAVYDNVLKHPSIDKKDYGTNNRLIIRFEDLKCNPEEILSEMCRRWDIVWSDSLMTTTDNGKSAAYDNGERAVKDFDLGPVYNTYEKYFSEFDRLRIMIINAPWQRKYGYPYEKISRFSRRELQEMFLQEFRFDEMIAYSGSESEFVLEYNRQNMIRNRLLKTRMLEFFAEEAK